MHVRQATKQDLSAIADIYAHEVRTAVSTFDLEPPGEDYWRAKLDSREPGDHLLVAEDDAILGYAYSCARSGGSSAGGSTRPGGSFGSVENGA